MNLSMAGRTDICCWAWVLFFVFGILSWNQVMDSQRFHLSLAELALLLLIVRHL